MYEFDNLAGRYKIETTLGQGGFGVVYKAFDELNNCHVAIKEYFPSMLCTRHENGSVSAYREEEKRTQYLKGLQRFKEEAQRLRKLNHPNIIDVTDYLEMNGTAYLVMPCLRDLTLGKYLKTRQQLTPQQVAILLEPLIGALDYIHSQGLLHRDISPENILIDENDNPVLIDFGAARYIAGSKTLSAIVKDGYSPIEQYSEETRDNPQGPYTDIYGLSATMYRAITGSTPPSSVRRSVQDQIQTLSGNYPAFEERLLAMIDAGLAYKPMDRPQTVKEWSAIAENQTPEQAQTRPVARSADTGTPINSEQAGRRDNAESSQHTGKQVEEQKKRSKRIVLRVAGVAILAIIIAYDVWIIYFRI
jgi:serine/threonine protein kinase